MTPEQKKLVKSTWAAVVPIADTAAGLFYGRLFETDPSTQPLFQGADMPEQRKKLMQAMAVVVNGIDDLGELVPTVEELARRHIRYGVKDPHYDSVGAALLWTLEQGLGEQWTPDAKAAWSAAYGTLAGVMRAAAATA